MFDIQNYSSFIVAVIIFQLIPGAGTITILNASARNGVRAGMSAVFGTLSGDFIYMLCAVLGLAAILSAAPQIIAYAQWAGAGYLCFLGWKLFRSPIADHSADLELEINGWTYFRQALAVSLTNPKVIMFFMAFFPLFLSDKSGPMVLLILMLHVTIISFLYQMGLVVAGNAIARRFSKYKYLCFFAARLPGVVLIGFGLKMAFNIR